MTVWASLRVIASQILSKVRRPVVRQKLYLTRCPRSSRRLLIYSIRCCSQAHHRQHVSPTHPRRNSPRRSYTPRRSIKRSRSKPSVNSLAPPSCRRPSSTRIFIIIQHRHPSNTIPHCALAHLHQPFLVPQSSQVASCSRRILHVGNVPSLSGD